MLNFDSPPVLLRWLACQCIHKRFSFSYRHTLVPEAIYRGSEERSESPLVESVGNLTSMLSQVQKLNLDDDWLNEYVSHEYVYQRRFASLLAPSINRLWNQGMSIRKRKAFMNALAGQQSEQHRWRIEVQHVRVQHVSVAVE